MNRAGRVVKGCSRAAFTLAEVMVSLLIVSLSAAGIFGLSSAVQNMNTVGERVSDATSLTESKIEEFRSQDYAAVTSGTDTVGVFTRNWTVTTNTWRKSVRVQTSWMSRQGSHDITWTAILAE
ncbi:MAG: type II secretion system protein [Lentisphaerae bacterium]|nr:type II secretion system protein [Lentisphaerota bacterium]